MIILSADPGTKNFAISITQHKIVGGRLRSKILATGMIDTTIKNLNHEVVKDIKRFERDMIALRRRWKPDHVYFERFQSRGLKGTTIECINIMLGIMIRVFHDLDPRLLLASTWKNRIGRRLDLKSSYKDFGLTRKHSPKTPHELDATLIGFYGACRRLGLEDFAPFNQNNWGGFVNWFLTSDKL